MVRLADWDGADAATAYFDGNGFRCAMRDDGVVRKPEMTLLERLADSPVVPRTDYDGDRDGDTAESADADCDG